LEILQVFQPHSLASVQIVVLSIMMAQNFVKSAEPNYNNFKINLIKGMVRDDN